MLSSLGRDVPAAYLKAAAKVHLFLNHSCSGLNVIQVVRVYLGSFLVIIGTERRELDDIYSFSTIHNG